MLIMRRRRSFLIKKKTICRDLYLADLKTHTGSLNRLSEIIKNLLHKDIMLVVMEHASPRFFILKAEIFSSKWVCICRNGLPPLPWKPARVNTSWIGLLLCSMSSVASSHSFCTLSLSLFPRGEILASAPGSPDSENLGSSRCTCLRRCTYACSCRG